MNLTFSENDHEALAALRKANALVKAEKWMWEDVLNEWSPPSLLPFGMPESSAPNQKFTMNAETYELLSQVCKKLTGKQKEFADSCLAFFKQTGFLTTKQAETLYRILSGAGVKG